MNHSKNGITAQDAERRRLYSQRAQLILRRFVADFPASTMAKVHTAQQLDTETAYRLMKEISRDPKTGIQRSDLLRYAMEIEMDHIKRANSPLSILIFDIDDFKKINTEIGHVKADNILKAVAEIISDTVRTSDYVLPMVEEDNQLESVVRWGGEEFVVLLPGADLKQGYLVGNRIRRKIQQQLLGHRPNHQAVTLSGGLFQFDPAAGHAWLDVLEQTDQQLQLAKDHGKNIIWPAPG